MSYIRNGLGAAPRGGTIAQDPRVLVFEKRDYRGRQWAFPPGEYNYLTKAFDNDRISSIKVPSGLIVTLYERGVEQGSTRGRGWGKELTITGPKDIPQLHVDPYKFEDITSRIVVTTAASTMGAQIASGPDTRYHPAASTPGATQTPRVCPSGSMFDAVSNLCISPFGDGAGSAVEPQEPQPSVPSSHSDALDEPRPTSIAPIAIGIAAVIGAFLWFRRRRG